MVPMTPVIPMALLLLRSWTHRIAESTMVPTALVAAMDPMGFMHYIISLARSLA